MYRDKSIYPSMERGIFDQIKEPAEAINRLMQRINLDPQFDFDEEIRHLLETSMQTVWSGKEMFDDYVGSPSVLVLGDRSSAQKYGEIPTLCTSSVVVDCTRRISVTSGLGMLTKFYERCINRVKLGVIVTDSISQGGFRPSVLSDFSSMVSFIEKHHGVHTLMLLRVNGEFLPISLKNI